MKHLLTALVVGALYGLPPSVTASAQTPTPPPDQAIAAPQLAAILQQAGYPVELTADPAGNPLINTIMSGTNVRIFFYACETDRCSQLQFLAGFDMPEGISAEQIEDWNRSRRFGVAYRDTQNDPYVKVDLQVNPGGTAELIQGYVATTEAVLAQFKAHIGFES